MKTFGCKLYVSYFVLIDRFHNNISNASKGLSTKDSKWMISKMLPASFKGPNNGIQNKAVIFINVLPRLQ